MEPDDDSVSADARLEALTAELARVSSDHSGFLSLIIGFVSSALVAAGGFIALNRQDANNPPQDWMWGLVLLIPLLIASYAVIQTGKAVVRVYYSRFLERKITDLVDPSWRTQDALPAGAQLASVIASYDGNKRSDMSVRLTTTLLYLSITGILVWAPIYAIVQMESGLYRFGFGVLYAATVCATVATASSAFFRGRKLWARIEQRTLADLRRPLSPEKVIKAQSLGRYILMPRLNDFIVKAIFLHLAVTVFGAILLRLRDPSQVNLSDTIRSVIALIVGFEFLVYQARYMLNDWRGRESDREHSNRHLRRRLPDLDTDLRISIFKSGGILRAALGIIVPVALLGWRLGGVILALSVVSYGLAVLYEWLRSRTTFVLDDTGCVTLESTRYLLRRSVPVYVVVGTSYGLRAAAGLWFGTEQTLSMTTVVALGFGFYVVGVMSVMMAWALEGATSISVSGRDATTAGSPWRIHIEPAMLEKTHVVALGARAKGIDDGPWTVEVNEAQAPDDEAHLSKRNGRTDPWNAVAAASVAVVAASGSSLVRWPDSYSWDLSLFVLVGLVAGVALVGGQIEMTMVSLVALGAYAYHVDSWLGLLGVVPTIAPILTYLNIKPLKYSDSINFVEKVKSDFSRVHSKVGTVVEELRR